MIGISGGALNAAVFAMHPLGHETHISDELIRIWTHLKSSDMYRIRSLVPDIWNTTSIFDTTCQHAFMHNLFRDASMLHDRLVSVSVTNYETFENQLIDSHDARFQDGIVASSAFPVIYQPVDLDGMLSIDGAFNLTQPVQTIIDQCNDQWMSRHGVMPDEVHVDIIVPNGDLKQDYHTPKSIPDVMIKIAEHLCSSVLLNDYHKPRKNVITRLFKPSKPLGGVYLSFMNSKEYMELGYKDTVKYFETL